MSPQSSTSDTRAPSQSSHPAAPPVTPRPTRTLASVVAARLQQVTQLTPLAASISSPWATRDHNNEEPGTVGTGHGHGHILVQSAREIARQFKQSLYRTEHTHKMPLPARKQLFKKKIVRASRAGRLGPMPPCPETRVGQLVDVAEVVEAIVAPVAVPVAGPYTSQTIEPAVTSVVSPHSSIKTVEAVETVEDVKTVKAIVVPVTRPHSSNTTTETMETLEAVTVPIASPGICTKTIEPALDDQSLPAVEHPATDQSANAIGTIKTADHLAPVQSVEPIPAADVAEVAQPKEAGAAVPVKADAVAVNKTDDIDGQTSTAPLTTPNAKPKQVLYFTPAAAPS
ncbi:hypothetical protein OC835_007777, partial [Tilletia horrida]